MARRQNGTKTDNADITDSQQAAITALLAGQTTEQAAAAAGEELLGWYDDDYLYILPDASYNRVARFLRDESATLSVKKPTLAKYLAEEGLLVAESEGRTTELLRVGSEVRRVWRLDRHKVQETTGALNEKP